MKRFTNILLLADGECWQDTPLLRAISLAKHNQANLTIISPTIFPNNNCSQNDSDYNKLKKTIVNDRRDQLEKIISKVSTDISIKVKIIKGEIFPGVIHEVLQNRYDLVMKCSEKNNSLQNRLFGSTDMHLLRKCPCPVWNIHANEKEKYQRFFAAINVQTGNDDEMMDDLNNQILEITSSLALAEFSEFHIVHAWTAPGESYLSGPRFGPKGNTKVTDLLKQQKLMHETKVDELVKSFTENISQETLEYLQPQVHILKGEPYKVIPDLALRKKADLVVMGTAARTGIPGFVKGNTSESILKSIGCSVLTIKHPEFATPVTV